MKRIPFYPRTAHAVRAAREFILKSDIRSLPVKPFELYKKHGWAIKSMSQVKALIQKNNSPIDEYELNCDAKTYLTGNGQYLTIYDDAVSTEGRILWTIAHEIGHIVLRHMEDFEQTEVHKGLTKNEIKVLESEANTFASELLAPEEVLKEIKCVKKSLITRLCGLSGEAAENRERTLSSCRSKDTGDIIKDKIYRQFYNFIANKEYYHKIHFRVCPHCRNYILSSFENFCSICGSKITLTPHGQGIIYNDGVEINENKRALLCPNCHSISHHKLSTVCAICGAYLVNFCTGEKRLQQTSHPIKALPGSARFCPICGSKTTFFKSGFLPPWDKAQENFKNRQALIERLRLDKDTGSIFKDWLYFLRLLREDGELHLYEILRGSIAKLDYDTLFLYTPNFLYRALLSKEEVQESIIKMFRQKMNIPILEIIP